MNAAKKKKQYMPKLCYANDFPEKSACDMDIV